MCCLSLVWFMKVYQTQGWRMSICIAPWIYTVLLIMCGQWLNATEHHMNHDGHLKTLWKACNLVVDKYYIYRLAKSKANYDVCSFV